ncbi:hypothetical protein CFP75_33375 [Amycolatopsis alba DSM 44262]|uniref:Uncharacterized protein n=1 Tax=Amycolatopsis alba DSM 44262 TaxID=1125972 RepID=A0A229RE05_AMYAL|nr:hypothetical protein CFP75_33375 [Amycolatopsis alba DSM 44262]
MTFDYGYTMACSACPAITPLTSTDYHHEINQAHIACHGCGADIHFGRAVMALRDADDPALDDDYLATVAWYHTSTHSDWPWGSRTMPAATLAVHRRHMPEDAVDRARVRHENQALHLGTYEAAIEAMLRRMHDQDDGGAQFFLYRVALRAADLTAERGWRDENTDDAARISQDDLGDADVVRYLNVFESPGSISLAVRPSAIATIQRIGLPISTLPGDVEPSLLVKVGELRAEHDRWEPERAQLKPSPLDLLRREASARREALLGHRSRARRRGLPGQLPRLLEEQYLSGVSEPVRERFTGAVGAWHSAQEAQVSDTDYVTRYARMAALLTQHRQVRHLLADADLLSAGASPAALGMLLRRGRDEPRSFRRSLWALHPPLRRRLDVLDRGDIERHTRAEEGFAFGALIGVVQPTLSFFLEPLLQPIADLRMTVLVAVLLLGYAWGTTVWRAHTADDAQPVFDRVVSVLGLPAGVVLGLAFSLTGTGSEPFEAVTLWHWALGGAALIGAASLCGGIAALWHRHRPGTSPWWVGLVAVLVFTGAIELIDSLGAAVKLGGVVEIWLGMTAEPWWALLAGEIVIAVVAWLLATGARLRMLCLAVVISLPVAVSRLIFSAPILRENALDHLLLDGVVASVAGLVAFLICVVAGGRAGVAAGVACAWPAALLTALVLTLKFNHPMDLAWLSVRQVAANLAPALLLLTALTAIVPARGGTERTVQR